MKVFIYYLICPIDKKVKYVGMTSDPKKRYNQHIKKLDKSQTKKRIWLEMLFSKKLKPEMKIIESHDNEIVGRENEQAHVNKNIETILNIHNPAKGVKSFKR